MGEQGWDVVFLLGIVAAVAAIIIVATWQIFAVGRTSVSSQAEIARDDAYRKLAQDSAASQQAILEEQRKIARDMADLRERMTSVETMMREVG